MDSDRNYRANLILDETEQNAFIMSIIRYMGHLAPKATHESKFMDEYDDYYQTLSLEHDLVFYHFNEDEDYIYFLATRKAPSLYGKQVATAGKVRFNDEGEVEHYMEEFRTWKMVPEELSKKSAYLFDRYINGQDLSPYYPENSGSDEFIEFPNQTTWFDDVEKRWMSSLFNPSEQLKRAGY